jgi:tetrapyrrole methylase family protein/MazG family protein
MITLVGLGVEKGDLTERGKEAILNAECVILRTGQAKSAESVKALGVPYRTLDEVYTRSRSFTTLHKKLAKEVIAAAKDKNVVYCVDGNVTEDRSAELLLKKRGVQVVGGVSKAARAMERAKVSAVRYAAVSAYDLAETGELTLPAVIYDLDNEFLAGDVKMYLADKIGEEQEVTFLYGEKKKKIKVYELDRQKNYDYTTAVVAGDIPLLKKVRFTVKDLQDIIVRLRRPDGCPWDKAQTPETIRMNMVEEAYELVDAIDSGDADKIREETGDVLLQAVFHAVMQEELGNFNLTDSLSELCQKLIHRHTHIFGKDKATDEASALSVWEANKEKEKGQDTYSKAVNDVPRCFPACMRAQKVQKRAGKSGFDFANAEEAAKKIYEEAEEWGHARDEGDKEHIQEELGDLLFAVVNAGRLSGADCELALKESTDKFVRRFTALEEAVLADGKEMKKLSAEELDEYYQKIKQGERGA